ncbi:hypothetical protein Sama_1352 [Shewanella amazonensis SB2B]|uniref:Uncharacterized protein n=1 Tax=Shewanella amazonensis (strain ATCC BAA-1098 / SB2B) TaxID=326297 RepID=A1S5A3_SHEAM|nr:hypothetical protein Sama_1352 [Shewanella amazonensis SB2B]
MKSAFKFTCSVTRKPAIKDSIPFVVMLWLVCLAVVFNGAALFIVIALGLEEAFASFSNVYLAVQFSLFTGLFFALVYRLGRMLQ